MRSGRAWLALLMGFAVWLGCFLLVAPVSERKASRVLWLMRNEPGYMASYESWEMESWSAGTSAGMVVLLVVFVCLFGFVGLLIRTAGHSGAGVIRPAIGVGALLATWPFWSLLIVSP